MEPTGARPQAAPFFAREKREAQRGRCLLGLLGDDEQYLDSGGPASQRRGAELPLLHGGEHELRDREGLREDDAQILESAG